MGDLDLIELRRQTEAARDEPWGWQRNDGVAAAVLQLLDRIDALEAEVLGLSEAYETAVATNRRLIRQRDEARALADSGADLGEVADKAAAHANDLAVSTPDDPGAVMGGAESAPVVAQPDEKPADLMSALETSLREASEAREARKRQREAGLLPCPRGCGCVTAEDPDARDCACDGPCCFGENWPIRAGEPESEETT